MAVSVQNCVSFQNTAKKYETSTGKCHRFIPSVSQEFDCRVKANIKPAILQKDVRFKDEEFKSTYKQNYTGRSEVQEQRYRPPHCKSVEYLRTVQEKLFTEPPAPISFNLSEMKDSFRLNYPKPEMESIKAPCNLAKCYIVKEGVEQQPAVIVNQKGFWKWNDPYLTVYKSEFNPYDQVDDSIKDRVLTFYNESEFDLPPASGNKTMYDKYIFKNVLPGRWLTRAQNRVPCFGMQSEYQGHYVNQTSSYLYPYLRDRCTLFEDSLSEASRWQNLAPPGMYCSEYCNYGGLSVRRTVDPGAEKKQITHSSKCCPLDKTYVSS